MTRLEYRYYPAPLSQARGFYVCNYGKFSISIGINLFYHTNGEYILSEYLCDGILDCSNRMDEDNCTCPYNALHHSACLLQNYNLWKDEKSLFKALLYDS